MTLSMHSFVSALQAFTTLIGKTCRWFSLAMVVVTCLVVLLRYAFDYSSIAMQETVMYLHASLFMFGAAYTWQQQGHVRVDVLYHQWSKATQQRIDLLGTLLLLLPTSLFLLYISWDYVMIAWANGEKSHEAGGLPFIYLLKSFLFFDKVISTLNFLCFLLSYFHHFRRQTFGHQFIRMMFIH